MARRFLSLCLAAVLLVPQTGFAQSAKKPLTHDVYDGWKSIQAATLSRNGEWTSYAITPQEGDSETVLRRNSDGKETRIPRATSPTFTRDGKFFVYIVVPTRAEVEKARKENKAPKDQPKNNLVIHNLDAGTSVAIERVRTVRWPRRGTDWFAYQLEEPPTPPKAEDKPAAPKPPMNEDQAAPAAQAPAAPAAQGEKKDDKPKKKREHTAGSEWILRRVSDGKEIKLADVGELVWAEDGGQVLYSVSSKDGATDGVMWLDLASEKTSTIAKGMGQYRSLTLHKETGKIAFLTDRDRYAKDPTEWTVHVWNPGDAASKEMVNDQTAGLGKDWVIVSRGIFQFSQNGSRLLFATGAKPEPPTPPAPAAAPGTQDKPILDVWSWHDKQLQTVQLLRAAAERTRSYEAMVDLAAGSVRQLEDEHLETLTIGQRGNGRWALGSNSDAYDLESSWTGGNADVYVVDVTTGVRKRFIERGDGASMTVDGEYAIWYDSKADDWMSYHFATGQTRNVTASIPGALYDREWDVPGDRGAAGGPFMVEDGRFMISDWNDLWVIDPSGKTAPRNVTEGVGKVRNWRFTPAAIPSDDDRVGFPAKQPIWLNMLDRETIDSGVYMDQIEGGTRPTELVRGPKRFGISGKALDADRVLITRQDFYEFPNLWLTNVKMENPVQISDANPQQKDYIWGRSEQVRWTSADGVPLQGILIKPENFDYSKKYPMIVYFYEREIENLHGHRVPSPSASTINPTMFASNGYLVFIPDIPYVEGYPGESAERAILPGVTMMLDRGYVKRDGVGIQGQSWGGYQVMHLVTRTNMFKAAGAGAAVSNMISAYGGIREGSGLVRQFQYEVGQSRIAGSLWEYPLRYIENSPIFFADKVNTPVLMMNNDRDDAVPFWQGVEMFTALRRLQKPVWMLNYNGDRHNLMQRANRKDLSIRLHQFFDHYLKGEPAPRWMTEGIPATRKGKDLGYEIPKAPIKP